MLSQAGAPLSWTIERAGTSFACERVGRQRLTSASLSERSEQCARSEGTRSSSRSDDEVGGYKSAIRACDVRAADLQEEPTKSVEKWAEFSDTIVSLDPTKTAAPGEHRSERSEPLDSERSEWSNQARRTAVTKRGLPVKSG